MKSSSFALSAAILAALTASTGSAQVLSNGTGGGDFATDSTWALGNVPTGAFQVQAGDTVIANAGLNYSTANNNIVYGTLTVNSGASIVMGQMNNAVVSNSTINVAGGILTMNRFNAQTGSANNVVNVTGGTLTHTNNTQILHHTINVSGSGVFRTNAVNAASSPIHLSGNGTIIFENVAKIGSGASMTWNGGTVFLSSGAAYSASDVTRMIVPWASNAANVLALSSQASKQTITFNSGVSATQGIMAFNVYSSITNDSDLVAFSASNTLSLGSGVELRINGLSLTGAPEDYLGQSYQLFSMNNGDYGNINASVASTIWTIGGGNYEIDWINNLATNGTLTIGAITAIPEPSSFGALGGVVALTLASSRRRAHR